MFDLIGTAVLAVMILVAVSAGTFAALAAWDLWQDRRKP